MHLLGQFPYISLADVQAELEAADPNPKAVWGRQRLDYQLKARREDMLKEQRGKRRAKDSPTDINLTEGFGLGELDTTFLGFAPSAPSEPAAANPLGGRPLGSTLAASRDAKKVNTELVNSAVRAWASRRVEQAAAREVDPKVRRNIYDPEKQGSALDRVIQAKIDKYKLMHPGLQLVPPKAATVRSRVQRKELAPNDHDLEVGVRRRGPKPPLEDAELVLLRLIEEMAEGGLFMTGEQLCSRMAAIIDGTPAGEAFAELAARSRG